MVEKRECLYYCHNICFYSGRKNHTGGFKNSVLFVSGSSTEEIEARLFRSDFKLTARRELTG